MILLISSLILERFVFLLPLQKTKKIVYRYSNEINTIRTCKQKIDCLTSIDFHIYNEMLCDFVFYSTVRDYVHIKVTHIIYTCYIKFHIIGIPYNYSEPNRLVNNFVLQFLQSKLILVDNCITSLWYINEID